MRVGALSWFRWIRVSLMLVAMEDLALKLEWQLSDCEVRGLIAIGEPLNHSPRPRTSDLFENDDKCYHWHTYYTKSWPARFSFVLRDMSSLE